MPSSICRREALRVVFAKENKGQTPSRAPDQKDRDLRDCGESRGNEITNIGKGRELALPPDPKVMALQLRTRPAATRREKDTQKDGCFFFPEPPHWDAGAKFSSFVITKCVYIVNVIQTRYAHCRVRHP
jgi:hypothetical protein